jgi:glyoxylase-like metal-dependent hydrolase (beta-lactamase superfamily II)
MSSTTATDIVTVPVCSPAPGETAEVLPGVHWLVTSLPFRLRAINLWLLRDGSGWTMIDCGFPLADVRNQIEAAWSNVLGGKPITRLVVTHHHPDHVGNCRWICERWHIAPTMTKGAYENARVIFDQGWEQNDEARVNFWRRHGLAETAAADILKTWSLHRRMFESLPKKWHVLRDGSILRINGCDWQVMTAEGHAPEQALLHSPAQQALISSDQILPKITPNVSVPFHAPESDPIADFLASNRRIADTCGDVLVLPSHKAPFHGLHARIGALEKHHEQRLALLENALKAGPQTAAALMPVLFGDLSPHETAFAMGEIIAHLNHLVRQKRARRLEREDRIFFAA